MNAPIPTTRPVAAKVKAATIGAGAGAIVSEFVVWAADEIFWNGPADPPVPGPVSGFISLVVVAGLTFAAGWLKKSAPADV